MKLPPLFFGFVVFPFILSSGYASDLDSQIQNVKAVSEQIALAGAASKKSSGGLESVSNELREISSSLNQMDSYLQNNNFDEARRMVGRVLRSTKNDDLKKALQGLLEQIDAEQAKQSKALEDKFAALTKKVDAALQKATPEELARIQDEVEDFRYMELYSGGRRNQRISNRVDRLNSFLGQWQQLLDAEMEGNYAEALRILANLQNNNMQYRVPEGLVTARRHALEEKILASQEIKETLGPLGAKIATMIGAAKTPQDLIALQQKVSILENAQRFNTGRTFYNQLSNNLQEFATLTKRYEDGDYYGVASTRTYDRWIPSEFAAPLSRKREELRAQAMAKLFDLPELGLPGNNESLAEFLYKKAEAAFAAGQWETLYSLVSAYNLTVTTPCSNSALKGVECMLAAIALESASQWKDAAIEYRNVLRQPGRLSPRKAAAAALQKLEKERSAELSKTAAPVPATPSES